MKSHVCDNMLHGCTDQRLIYPYINSYGGILVMHICKYEKKLRLVVRHGFVLLSSTNVKFS